MILCIAEVLTDKELAAIRRHLAKGDFVDGRETAGWHARLVKHNQQLASGPGNSAAGEIVRGALSRHEVFRAGVQPHRLRPPLFSRSGVGQGYGAHVDDALMGDAPRLRTDVAVTVFLSAPEDYEGGELVIDTPGGELGYKLAAGSALTYPATSLHRVEPVTAGRREVAVTWVQSLVRAAEQREILFDLDRARRAIFEADGKTPAFDAVTKSYANLLRLWAEP